MLLTFAVFVSEFFSEADFLTGGPFCGLSLLPGELV